MYVEVNDIFARKLKLTTEHVVMLKFNNDSYKTHSGQKVSATKYWFYKFKCFMYL